MKDCFASLPEARKDVLFDYFSGSEKRDGMRGFGNMEKPELFDFLTF
ncbi:hypothetical protein [Robertkochia aurantiaca]|nr:hypothetical protein [Robertkochia sp. 3YJGBD-33]